MNNTNLKYGDIKALDFKLPAGTGDAAGVRACQSFCENRTECAAFVFVRASRGGPRCAIKGAAGYCVPELPCDGCAGSSTGCGCIAMGSACSRSKPASP